MTTINLGLPRTRLRRRSRQVLVGDVPVGGDAPVSVQSMTTTLTADVDATLRQIAELTAAGCQIVRVAVPSQDDADALPVEEVKVKLSILMGCVVNGPGEAREADLGVSSGNGKGQIFVRGEVVKTVPESEIVETLLDEAMKRDWT
jgi:4-hydroxy-3-methylbut-2-en-1-yl diphosphate synthase IspG/GcpE